MNIKKMVTAGLASGVIFYALSLIVWWLFQFLPVTPTPVVILNKGLQQGWMVEHLIVSLFVGLLWMIGYAICRSSEKLHLGGSIYGMVIYVAGILPAFIIQFIVFTELRALMVYGAIVSLIAVLLSGKIISFISTRN